MTEFTADRAEEIQIEKMLLPKDRLDIAADQEKHEHVGTRTGRRPHAKTSR